MSAEGINQLEQEYAAVIESMDPDERVVAGNIPESFFSAVREIDELYQRRAFVRGVATKLEELVELAEEGANR